MTGSAFGEPGVAVQAFAESVAGQQRSADVNARLDEAISAVSEHATSLSDPAQAALFTATLGLLAASKATMQAIGECHIAEPYADVYVVMTDEGIRYCCNHPTQHCRP